MLWNHECIECEVQPGQDNMHLFIWLNKTFVDKGGKTHIPPEIGFALGTNANEIYTKKKKYTWPTPAFCVGTQRQLYSTDWRRGLVSGVTQILGLASGIGVGGNAKIYQHVGIFCVG